METDMSEHSAEKDVPRVFDAAIFRHTYNPWTGRCGCGEGPFGVDEHKAHVTSIISPGSGRDDQLPKFAPGTY
jgi:hypothetical protein